MKILLPCTIFLYLVTVSFKNVSSEKVNAIGEQNITEQPSSIVNIPGNQVYMVPPARVKPATGTMKGFIKDEVNTFLSVMEIRGRSFQTEIATHSPERIRIHGNSIFWKKKHRLVNIKED